MKWVTRKRIHVNRAATGWLIRRLIGFDAPGARFPHKDASGRCSFEQLVHERLSGDRALMRLAAIVHGADFPEQIDTTPESAGLWAISQGFTDVGNDDDEILERASFLYDSLYAHLKRAAGSG